MGRIWELENKFAIWKEIEVLACEAQAQLGQAGITPEEAQWIRDHADFTVEEIDEIEKVTNHDVIAFTTCMANYIDADIPEGAEKPSRWVHYGMTSSDLGDTALSYQVTQALRHHPGTTSRQLGETCKRRAFELAERPVRRPYARHPCRAHDLRHEVRQLGVGPRSARSVRLQQARAVAATGAITGAVGTYSTIDPFVEQYVCEKMGLTPDPLSTQVLAARPPRPGDGGAGRDRLPRSEAIALQVRLLQQSDVIEAEEPFTKPARRAASAMPHKRNPITAERVCGLARVVKSERTGGLRRCGPVVRARHLPLRCRACGAGRQLHRAGLHVRQDAVDAGRPANLSSQDGAQLVAHQGTYL